jgi:hypothetical protein
MTQTVGVLATGIFTNAQIALKVAFLARGVGGEDGRTQRKPFPCLIDKKVVPLYVQRM